MEERARRWIAGVVVLATTGCATIGSPGRGAAGPPADEPGWFARRGRDLLAIFDLDLSLGPGVGVRAAVTRHAQLGFMMLGPTETAHLTPTTALVVGKRGDQFGAWRIEDQEYGLSPWYPSDATLQRIDAEQESWRGPLAETRGTMCSVQVHAAIIGVEFGFDPAALGRFVAGLVGFEGEPAPIQ